MDVTADPAAPRDPSVTVDTKPVWRVDWLTPWVCRLLLLLMLVGGFLMHVRYLHHAPIDLSGDEAHYWDWSRRLDWSYYSKGPLVALIIRASCAVFGDTMPAVRYPALVLSVMTAVVGYLLTLKLFKSDRLALGVTVLNVMVPMFVAGSLLMTIDPPFYFCWAAATYALSFALMKDEGGRMKDEKGGGSLHPSSFRLLPWISAGLLVGIGALAKLASLVWLPAMLLFLVIDRPSRPLLKSAGPWIAVLIALLCTTPIYAWNARHEWVTFRHVGTQTGVTGPAYEDDTSDSGSAATTRRTRKKAPRTGPVAMLGRMGEFFAAQIAVLGPGLVLFMVRGVGYAFKKGRTVDPNQRSLQMLAIFGVVFFVGVFLLTIRSKVQVNWPAPAYFTLMILGGYFLATRLQNLHRWKRWRGWVWGTVFFGIIMQPLAHDFSMAYPLINWMYAKAGKKFEPTKLDPSARLRGWEELGQYVSAELPKMRPDTFILCDDYQQTGELAFYIAGQPITYCAGSYYSSPKRHTQYDIWPDRRLDQPALLGRDAIVIGKGGGIHPDIVRAFERVEPMQPLIVTARGIQVRSVTPWRCYGFKGMTRPAGASTY